MEAIVPIHVLSLLEGFCHQVCTKLSPFEKWYKWPAVMGMNDAAMISMNDAAMIIGLSAWSNEINCNISIS